MRAWSQFALRRLVWQRRIATILALLIAPAMLAGQSLDGVPRGVLRVILLGTMGGPTFSPDRLGISTLVIAGDERLLFDAGRAATTGLSRAGVSPVDVTKVFLTHLHSDHIVDLPALYLEPWASLGRKVPFMVWGPKGTRSMMAHIQKAFAFDIHVRRDVDERFPAEGIKVQATDITEGVVYRANAVTVTAFLVDHAPVAPAFGYRVDYMGRSVVLSGDTKPSRNLEAFARGTDVLIHEVGRWKSDPLLSGPPDEVPPGGNLTRRELTRIADHHTDAEEAGKLFDRLKPRLAVFSHHGGFPSIVPLAQRHYNGRVELGEDLMTIDIGDAVDVRRARGGP